MDGGHQTINDSKIVIQNLCDRSKAVCRARSIGHELSSLDIGVLVDTADEHRSVILGRSRHHDILCTSVDMGLCLLLGEEETSGRDNILSSDSIPCQVIRILASCDTDFLSVHNKLGVLDISFDCAFKLTMHCVILEHVRKIIHRTKVIDSYNCDIFACHCSTKNKTTDSSKSVNANFH